LVIRINSENYLHVPKHGVFIFYFVPLLRHPKKDRVNIETADGNDSLGGTGFDPVSLWEHPFVLHGLLSPYNYISSTGFVDTVGKYATQTRWRAFFVHSHDSGCA